MIESRESAANLRIEMPLVFPGTYQVSLSYTPSDEEQQVGGERKSTSPVSVTIEPGREAELRLALP